MDNSKVVAQALFEYGQAMRTDCSGFDSGTIEWEIGVFSEALLQDTEITIEELRCDLCLMADGSGRWEQIL